MTTQVQSLSVSHSKFVPALFAGLLGLFIVAIAGNLQAGALHDAAHDVRHATGFPCH
jgi:cobalt transporter subunit CbtB